MYLVSYYAKSFTYLISFNPYHNLLRYVLLPLIYKWG